MRKLTKFILSVLTGTMVFGMTAFASEFSVTPANAVFYTNENTIVLMDASEDAQVVLPSCDINLPIQVTGITSNGYWQIALGNETYYVAGIGLSPEAENAVVTDNANTTVPATTTVATPVQTNTQSKYVCVIEEGDKELFESKTYAHWNNSIRKDYTNNSYYVYFRDQLEEAYSKGKKDWEVEYSIQNREMTDILGNLCVDFMKAHSNVRMGVYTNCPTSSYDNPFDGTQYATYSVIYYIP